MSRPFPWLIVVSGAMLAALAWLVDAPSNAQEAAEQAPKAESQLKPSAKKLAMKAFMRKKLSSSQNIIEGLALEDFELIERGAKDLRAMSAAAEFMVSNDPLYKEHSDDFRKVVTKLEKAAREKRIDGATLNFMDMTMSCVECHKYVRTILIAQGVECRHLRNDSSCADCYTGSPYGASSSSGVNCGRAWDSYADAMIVK